MFIPKDFYRPVFPLGGANGNGKSVLLQFVYALLRQWNSTDKSLTIEFIRTYIDIEESEEPQIIAVINVWDGKQEYVLDFQVTYMDGTINLMPLSYRLPLDIYLITHSCESHEFLIKGNHFFYYEDIFHRVSNVNSLGKKKYYSLVDWVGTKFMGKQLELYVPNDVNKLLTYLKTESKSEEEGKCDLSSINELLDWLISV